MKIALLLLSLLVCSCSYPRYVEPTAEAPHALISTERTPTVLGQGIPKLIILNVNKVPLQKENFDDLKLLPGKNDLRVRVISSGRTTAETEISFHAKADTKYHINRESDNIYHIITIKDKSSGEIVVKQSVKKVYKPMERVYFPGGHEHHDFPALHHSPFEVFERNSRF